MFQIKFSFVIMLPLIFAGLSVNALAQDKLTENSSPQKIGAAIMWGLHHHLEDSESEDPIAIKLTDCVSREAAIGIKACLANAYESYDKILNAVYQLALKANDEKTQNALKLSEQKWIAFKNAEGLAKNAYGGAEPRGSILGISIGYQNISAIRERISELMFYLGTDQI